jgi:hypothetical protein
LSSTLIAFASFRNMALPQRSSWKDTNIKKIQKHIRHSFLLMQPVSDHAEALSIFVCMCVSIAMCLLFQLKSISRVWHPPGGTMLPFLSQGSPCPHENFFSDDIL